MALISSVSLLCALCTSTTLGKYVYMCIYMHKYVYIYLCAVYEYDTRYMGPILIMIWCI